MSSDVDAAKISFGTTEAVLLAEGANRRRDEPPPVVRAAGARRSGSRRPRTGLFRHLMTSTPQEPPATLAAGAFVCKDLHERAHVYPSPAGLFPARTRRE